MQQSAAFARRIMELSSHPNERIKHAFLLAYGRPPTSGERSAAASFVKGFAPSTSYRARSTETLAVLCQSLLASAEFRYVD